MDDTFDELLAIEHAGWRALCNGTASQFYRDIMTDNGQMILANGVVMDRDRVVESLRDAPPWDGYDIQDAKLIVLQEQTAAIVYAGTGRRDRGNDFVAIMSSVYTRIDNKWRLALYTQTPIPSDG
ncbi:MAG: nuclear transport factor 2 family protein [Cyanobacteria bacterium J06641_5]